LPDPHVPGYQFPEPEDTIVGWTKTNNQKAISIMLGTLDALNQETAETFDGKKLRVFETWLDPTDVMSSNATGITNSRLCSGFRAVSKDRGSFIMRVRTSIWPPPARMGNRPVLAFVKYDPIAATTWRRTIYSLPSS